MEFQFIAKVVFVELANMNLHSFTHSWLWMFLTHLSVVATPLTEFSKEQQRYVILHFCSEGMKGNEVE